MSRLEWILSSFLILLLISLSIVGVLWWQQTRAAEPPSLTAEVASQNVERRQHSAKSAYQLAQQAAQAWSETAQLVEANATWPPGEQFDPQGANWSFTFYTADQDQLALITVVNTEATLFGNRAANSVYQPAPPSFWAVDSPEIIRLVMRHGGEQFMAENQTATLRLTLHFDRAAHWQADLFAPEAGRFLSLKFDVATGQLIDSTAN